ncbi:MAG: ankyrin repeat domain-containing protein [Abitibacteriaceae bacterium]|nr:ankyrin repeat domain-containing protein [Abditibacteriaceae bacterium]
MISADALFEAIARQAWVSDPGWVVALRQWLAHNPELVQARQADGSTLLHRAWAYPFLVQELLAHGAEANAQNDAGLTPLYYAAKWVQAEVIQIFIAHGADVNVVGEAGRTPLHWAALRGRSDVVHLLLAAGASKSAFDEQGKTPLQLAQENGKTHLGELLSGEC